ncbi:hypothetical protein [Paraburkholderia panacisoli]|nr:hypothetical protein [Paraburkholderia panacisoli]
MKSDLDEWIEFTRAWVDEQQGIQDAVDAAAFARFMAALGLNNETRGRQ